MTDPALKSLIKQASDITAGIPPSLAQVQADRPRRRPFVSTGTLATAASGIAAIIVLANLPTGEVQPPESQIDPDVYVLSDPLERSDWLLHSVSSQARMRSRSDWLLSDASPNNQAFASDHLVPDRARVSRAYLLVDQSGKPVTDPDQPNVIYVIERTTP